MNTISRYIQTKGEQLVADHKVTYAFHDQWKVQSGDRTYRVTVTDHTTGSGACTCQWYVETGRPCSHLFAVLLAFETDQYDTMTRRWSEPDDPFEGLV